MTDNVSPSPIIECFLTCLKEFLPADQNAKLQKHDKAIATTTSDGDESRALRCAIWAIKAASNKSGSHPRWKEIKEVHNVWKDTWFGAEFGLMTPHSSIAEDIRIQWTEAATDVIRNLAEEDGWQDSNWEELLIELIDLRS
jgi:hypothetical protein